MKALALFSGGLDSLLAIKIIREQGIDVTAIYFDIGFDSKDHTEVMVQAATGVDADFLYVDIKKQFHRDVLFTPQYGYGKYYNPCIDCHANMIRHAHAKMEELQASFIISGEVVGQRPKSQRKVALQQVAQHSGAPDLILRPLSAKLLPPTKPELEGWVERERLYDIKGRGRERQLELAEQFGLKGYAPPAGGCLLTEEYPSLKIRDLTQTGSFDVADAPLLNIGRYLILPDGARCIISRNEKENEILESLQNQKFELITPQECLGPVAVITQNASLNDKQLAISLTLAYGKTDTEQIYDVKINDILFQSKPAPSKQEAQPYMLQNVWT